MDKFFQVKKLQQRIEEINEYRYKEIKSIDEFYIKQDLGQEVNPSVLSTDEISKGNETWKKGEYWSGRDQYLWLSRKIEISKDWSSEKVIGLFDFSKTRAGRGCYFEMMSYVDGVMLQGLDPNHQEIFLTKEMIGKEIELTFRLWAGLEGGGPPKPQEHQFRRADIAILDEKTDDFYYMSSIMLATIQQLTENDPTLYELRTVLIRAYALIEWASPGSEEFYMSVYEACDYLNDAVEKMEKLPRVHVKGIGHTHIDVAWLWRLKHSREKAARSFTTVLRLMELFPEYIFLQSQPQLYEYIKEDFPDLYLEIKEKVKEGTWEIDGAMWVESDCNLVSGESLTRQILVGSKFMKDEFNKVSEFLWLPDVFGYSWALPQILKKSNINTFMTTKISWGHYNKMPHDTFLWKGLDGTEILTHFITTPTPGQKPPSWINSYNGVITPETVKGVWDFYSDKELNNELLIAYGYGDGGGGVNRDMLEAIRRIDKIPGLPSLKTSTAGEYFRNLQETVNNTDRYVHVWDGELYLETHRGTYTSQAYNKKENRKLEYLYRVAEMLTLVGALREGNLDKAEQEKLLPGWKILLTNQFHDIIPGSSYKDVYDDCRVDYRKARKIALEVIENFNTNHMQKTDNKVTLFNTSNWNMDEVVFLEGNQEILCYHENGDLIATQKVEGGTLIEVEGVEPLGMKVLTVERKSLEENIKTDDNCPPTPFTFQEDTKTLETPYYIVVFNDQGQFIRLYDKRVDREVITQDEVGNVLQIFEDKPISYDAWDIDIFYQEKMKVVDTLTSLELCELGRIRCVIKLIFHYHDSVFTQKVMFYANHARIDFVTEVDFHEQKQLLKVAFPVNIRTTYATYDIQYGNVRRPNHWNTSWEHAKFETVAHRFADLSERGYGVALLNDCKYGYDVKDNVMRLSLIKSATYPDCTQDQGLHEFTYSLLPHMGDFVSGEVVKESFSLNQNLCIMQGVINDSDEELFVIDGNEIEIDAIKKSEDGKYIVLRFHDYGGTAQKVSITPRFTCEKFAESDLMENPLSELELVRNRNLITSVGPYEIKTFLFQI